MLFLRKKLVSGKLPPKIMLGLCISLLLTMIVFVSTAEMTSQPRMCRAAAGLIHYLLLTTFFWMGVEGLNLFLCVIYPLKHKNIDKRKFFWIVSLAALGEYLVLYNTLYYL